MNKFYVYAYLYPETMKFHKIDDPFYIGKGKGNRCYAHLYRDDGNNLIKERVINKIRRKGQEPIVKKVFENLYEDEAFIIEKLLISYYGRRDNNTGILTNLTDGGDGCSGRKWTEQMKAVFSKIQKGNKHNLCKKQSDETTRKISEAQKGEKHYNYGKTLSEGTRQKLSEAKKGKTRSEEIKRKISLNNPNKKKVNQFNKDYFLIEMFNSITDATIKTEIVRSSIRQCCLGKRKSAGGYIWRYA